MVYWVEQALVQVVVVQTRYRLGTGEVQARYRHRLVTRYCTVTGTVLYCTVLCTILYCIVLYCTGQAILYCNDKTCCTVLYVTSTV